MEFPRNPDRLSSPSTPVEANQRGFHKRIADIVGSTVGIGADVVFESGKIAGFAAGRVYKGIGDVKNATRRGLNGGGYLEK